MAVAGLAALALPIAASAHVQARHPSGFLRARHGAVTSDSKVASDVGVEVLRAGGNAADAACATALALGVVHPFASGLGGGGFALVYLAKSDTALALDFRETAPAACKATPASGSVIPTQSGLSIGVPGEARGLAELVKRFGALPFSRCVEPAVRLARGFQLTPWQAKKIGEELQRNPTSGPALLAQIYSISEQAAQALKAGDRVARPLLARTLDRLRGQGVDALYRGELASTLVHAAQTAGSLLTLDDLANYEAVERRPLAAQFLGHRVFLMPPPSAGGIILAQALGIVSNRLDDLDRKQGPLSPDYLHLVAEALKHGFADRARFLGDPAFARIPLGYLLDPAYHRTLALRTRLDQVLDHENYGAANPIHVQSGSDAGTAHVSVVDRFGNAVALTTTINLEFGARIMAGDTGIILNDELDDFTATTGKPDVFALAGGAANLPAPGKRPTSSMSPTIVVGQHGVELVTGAAGGPRIVSATLQILLHVMFFGADVGRAVTTPRIHHQWEPDVLFYEPGLPAESVSALESKGHHPEVRSDLGKANVIVRTKSGLEAASDPRSGSLPAGY